MIFIIVIEQEGILTHSNKLVNNRLIKKAKFQ